MMPKRNVTIVHKGRMFMTGEPNERDASFFAQIAYAIKKWVSEGKPLSRSMDQ